MGKIDEAIAILGALGLPEAQQNERSALTLLALMDLKQDTPWSESRQRLIGIDNIRLWMRDCYGKQYAPNTRETIRRETIHQFEHAAVVIKNPDDPARPTNSPKTVYAITDEALEAIRKYDTPAWQTASQRFVRNKGKLIDKYKKRKEEYLIPVDLPNGTLISFSPGKHNELQKKVIEGFRLRFCPDAEVVYVGDVARKSLYVDEDRLEKLRVSIEEHGKLPDVVLYDPQTNRLFLIEAVTTHGPLSPKRQIELQEMLERCKAKMVYISAFPSFREFKKHINHIAWETEVWIEDNPDHVIHFNGPKFFTIYN
jgi:type II restriction enzyme